MSRHQWSNKRLIFVKTYIAIYSKVTKGAAIPGVTILELILPSLIFKLLFNKIIVMEYQYMNLNIGYDAPDEIWEKMPLIYQQLNGWLGFGTQDGPGQAGIPYWYSFNVNEKHISASVEPGGLSFEGLMDAGEWEMWVKEIKKIATKELGYKIGEIELGEVDD